MKKLTIEDLEKFESFITINQGMTVIPHPKNYDYNVKVRWLAFTLPDRQWSIYHSYSPYFFKKVGFKEDKLKLQFQDHEMLLYGTPLTDMVLVSILIPATREVYSRYNSTFNVNKWCKDHGYYEDEDIVENNILRIDNFEDSDEETESTPLNPF